MTKPRIGFLGVALSHPASFTHALHDLQLAQAVGAWADVGDDERAAKYTKQYGVPILATPEQVIEASDAIVVTTETHRHREFASMAIAAGKPVFVDKPFATHYADVVQVLDEARRAGVPVMSCSVRRYAPPFKQIADACRDGTIGKTISAVRYEPHGITPGDWQDRLETSGGFIFNFGIHCVDCLQDLLGLGAVEVYTHAARVNYTDAHTHDAAVMMIRHRSGAVGVAEVVGAYSRGNKVASAPALRVFGTDNALEARLIENQVFEYDGRRFGVTPYYTRLSGNYDAMVAFMEMVRTGTPAISYDDMLEVAAILEAARRSADESRAVRLDEVTEASPQTTGALS